MTIGWTRHIFAALAIGLVLTLLAGTAVAKGQDGGLAKPLGEIKWGDDKGEVIKKLKDEKLAELRERDDLKRDRVLMQREKKRVMDQMDDVEESFEKLDDAGSYRVSVISDEFTPKNNESLLRIKDKVANRFFFFVDGKLYKLVVAYNQDYLKGVGFESFVVQTAKKYGKPVSTEYGEVDGEEELVQAVWKDGQTQLRVENKKAFFGTFTMAFTDRSTLERLENLRRAAGGSDKREEGVSKRVKALTERPDRDTDADVVDGIVGDVDINFNEGRPKDQQVRQGQEDQGAVAAKDEPKKTKKKKKKTRKKKKKRRDFGDLDTQSGGDDLLIY